MNEAVPNLPTEQAFMHLSRVASVTHANALHELRQSVKDIYDLPDESSFLAMADVEDAAGHANPIHGLASIAPKILSNPDIARFVGVHEALHVQLGNSLAVEAIDSVAPGYRQYFHRTIIPMWLKGDVNLSKDSDYLTYHNYRGLIPGGWHGTGNVSQSASQETMKNYFSLLTRHELRYWRGGELLAPVLWDGSLQEALETTPPLGPESYAAEDALLARLIITGMKMGQYLRFLSPGHEYSRQDALIWEEGVANRIASDLTGLSLEVVDEVAKQDTSKLIAAEKLKEAGLTGQALAETIRSYSDLHALLREHF